MNKNLFICSYIRARVNSRHGGLGTYAIIIFIILILFIALYSFPRYISMRSAIYKISCKEIRKKIERAVQEYEANNTRSIIKVGTRVDLDFLKATGFLAEIQRCPEGGRFLFGLNNEIICTVHSENLATSVKPAEKKNNIILKTFENAFETSNKK